MALTDVIEAELLATLDGDGDPQVVLDRFAGSKGPLYTALARATAQAAERFAAVRTKLRDAQDRRRQAEGHARECEERAEKAERLLASSEQRLSSAERVLARHQALLDRADELHAAGFGEESLSRLGEVLQAAAMAEGKSTADTVTAFLDAAADWSRLAELRAGISAAEKRAAGTEADAHRRIEQAHLTQRAVAVARWLVQQKISTDTVEHWHAIAAKAGFTSETLAAALARALEQYGDLEKTRAAWIKAMGDLRKQHTQLTAEGTALRQEREAITAAIGAVQKHGIAAIRQTAEAASAEVQRVAEEFGSLTRQAEELRREMAFAHAMRNPDAWAEVEPDAWIAIMGHFIRWTQVQGVDAEAPVPEALRKIVEDQAKYPSLHGPIRLPLGALAAWMTIGLGKAAEQAMVGTSAPGGPSSSRRSW